MRNINKTKIFISAEVAGRNPVANEHATTDLHCCLENLDLAFRYVEGVYNGTNETAFCVFATPGAILETIDQLVNLGRRFSQESVLVVHGDNAAELCETRTQCSAIIGTFQEVAKPEPGEDCTIADGKYYVVR